ncbi:glycine betaine ABC transporter substrate-binding protein [Virgibacillus sp. MSP4-1]|uniref:glycine betaine ABC transporter substrate-binding protein n=1 Tax=Virgibacillus sp. MSP4-1 TaxID=2700081 RepID=UPI0003A070E3|nr:glycine betaine ABC transporter substrate-binding protein [Virgibacillus sp. MSP4-1]QHS23680.1 glycine betaine ABC transporter substrate-binding protein [Virgibacillus sp. MSP4-1]
MKKVLSFLLVLSLVFVTACGGSEESSGSDGSGDGEKKLVIGAKNFTEQFVLSKILSIYLKENGYEVEEKNNMASQVVRTALENQQVDLYWEYTGTSLVTYNNQDPIANADEAYEAVKEIDKKNGIVWLNPADVNNTYTLMMRKDDSEELGIKTISDLAEYMNENPDELLIGTNAEFATRPDGIKGVQKTYGFEVPSSNLKKMDSGLFYQALRDGQVDVATGFMTDSRIKAFDLVTLEDDKNFFPAYHAAITIHEDSLAKYPELEELLKPLAENLDSETMMDLNYRVDIDEESETDVARSWLVENGLIEE